MSSHNFEPKYQTKVCSRSLANLHIKPRCSKQRCRCKVEELDIWLTKSLAFRKIRGTVPFDCIDRVWQDVQYSKHPSRALQDSSGKPCERWNDNWSYNSKRNIKTLSRTFWHDRRRQKLYLFKSRNGARPSKIDFLRQKPRRRKNSVWIQHSEGIFSSPSSTI